MSLPKAAGIATELVTEAASQETVMCEACMDDVAIEDTTMLRCGHRFCNDCWTAYISIKIKEGESKNITCMMDKCKVKFDEALIPWYAYLLHTRFSKTHGHYSPARWPLQLRR